MHLSFFGHPVAGRGGGGGGGGGGGVEVLRKYNFAWRV